MTSNAYSALFVAEAFSSSLGFHLNQPKKNMIYMYIFFSSENSISFNSLVNWLSVNTALIHVSSVVLNQ